MKKKKGTAIAVYTNHEEAELAIIQLYKSAYDIQKLSLLEEEFKMNVETPLKPKPSKVALMSDGTPSDIASIGKVLGIDMKKVNLTPVRDKIVLSGGERSPLQ